MGTLALLRSATAHKRLESFAGICDASAGGAQSPTLDPSLQASI